VLKLTDIGSCGPYRSHGTGVATLKEGRSRPRLVVDAGAIRAELEALVYNDDGEDGGGHDAHHHREAQDETTDERCYVS